MGTANFSVSFSAVLSSLAGTVSPGVALVKSGSSYVVATATNRTALSRRADGIALDAGSSGQSIRVQHDGLVTTDITGLGAGVAGWVEVNASGVLARIADGDIVDGTTDLIGRCTVTGDMHVMPNAPTSLGGGTANDEERANDHPGADIGAKINAAIASLTGPKKKVKVDNSDTPYTWSTTVVLEPGTDLILGAGDYQMAGDVNAVQMKDRTSVVGAGSATRIIESPDATGEGFRLIRDYNSVASPDADGNTNLRVANFQVVGARVTAESARSTVAFGNVHEAVIEGVFLNGTSCNGLQAGGTSGLGFYASDIWIRHNRITETASQGIAVVNALRFHVEDNTLFNLSHTGTGNASYIDVEGNNSEDVLEDFTVCRNIIDARGSVVPGNGILIQGPSSDRTRGGVISDNTIIGGDYYPQDPVTSALVVAIFLNGLDDSIVSNNNIIRCGQAAISVASCNRCKIDNNRVTSTGGAADESIVVNDSSYNTISNNRICSPGSPYTGADGNRINETGGSDYNDFHGNYLDQKAGDLTSSGNDPTINLVGAHSKKWNNNFRGYVVGRGEPVSIAELRLHPVPYPGAGREVVETDGHAFAGDGGGAKFYWDDASTDTDDGVITVEPTYLDGGLDGRWKRVKQWLQYSTTERNALTLDATRAGFTIFNTSVRILQCWDGATWKDLFTGPAFDPATLALTGWWRADSTTGYDNGGGSGIFLAVASAGSSGANGNLTEATDFPAESTLNTHVAADGDGANDLLASAHACSTFLTTGAGAVAVLFYADTAAANAGAPNGYINPSLVQRAGGGDWCFSFSDAGVSGTVHDGVSFVEVGPVACTTGAWHMAVLRWDGATMDVSVDGDVAGTGYASVACTGPADLTGVFQLFKNFDGSAFFDGKIAEVMAIDSALSDADIVNLRLYFNTRYALGL